jgi:hypothetical protein
MRRVAPLVLAFLIAVPLCAASNPQSPPSALDAVRERRPEAASRLDAATRAVLSQVSAEQAAALARGELGLGDLKLPNGTPLADFLSSVFGTATYSIPFYSMDAGGGESAGGQFHLLGTIGQPDAAVLTNAGAGFTLVGGFRGRLTDFALFRDGFESGDSSRWSDTIP